MHAVVKRRRGTARPAIRDPRQAELLERLETPPEEPTADRGHPDRTLRRREEQGLVTAAWQMPQGGPARYTYTPTADDLQALDARADHIRAVLTQLEGFLERRETLRATAPPASARQETQTAADGEA